MDWDASGGKSVAEAETNSGMRGLIGIGLTLAVLLAIFSSLQGLRPDSEAPPQTPVADLPDTPVQTGVADIPAASDDAPLAPTNLSAAVVEVVDERDEEGAAGTQTAPIVATEPDTGPSGADVAQAASNDPTAQIASPEDEVLVVTEGGGEPVMALPQRDEISDVTEGAHPALAVSQPPPQDQPVAEVDSQPSQAADLAALSLSADLSLLDTPRAPSTEPPPETAIEPTELPQLPEVEVSAGTNDIKSPEAPETAEAPATPMAPLTAPQTTSSKAPQFDLVRVGANGNAVLAGRAAPGAEVTVLLGGTAVTTTRAGPDGKFAALFVVAPSIEPQQVSLSADLGAGPVQGAETLIIAPAPKLAAAPRVDTDAGAATPTSNPDPPALRAPAGQPRLLLADQQGVRVVQPATGVPSVQTSVSIDAIAYDVEGTVVLSGRGAGTVRIYLDNRAIETVPVAADGQWRTPLPVIDTGVYQLRVDELDGSGQVTSRTTTPFQREDADKIAALVDTQTPSAPGPRLLTVQPGSTLWGIARQEYGRGVLFVRVFEANRADIADPHWIYPGQVFTVPEESAPTP